MDLEALQFFVEVVNCGNFSRVAKDRNVAVSSVTRRIDMLEGALGAPLFNRSSRGVQLTDAGMQLLDVAQHVLTALDNVRDAIASTQVQLTGPLTVTAPATFGRRFVASAVASFLHRYPAIEVTLNITDDIVDIVSERVDVAVRIGVLPDSDLIATPLARQRRIAVASPDYIAHFGRPNTPLELLEHNCLSHGRGAMREGWWQFAGVNDGKPLRVRGNLQSDDSESLLRATLAGVGVAHLATWLVGEDVAAGRLVALFDDELRDSSPSRSGIHAVRVSGRAVDKARLFIDHLKHEFIGSDGIPLWERSLSKMAR